jgi:hypothetical protein
MSKPQVYLKIMDSVSVIQDRINSALADHINSVLRKSQSTLLSKVRKAAGGWVRGQPEIQSIEANDLAAHFGLPAGTAGSAVDAIVTSVQNATEIEITRVDRRLNGGLQLHFQPTRFADLLGLSLGHVKLEESGDLHWLKWLLESGHKIIVVNYHFTAGSGKGRSKGGIMTRGGAWRVPPQYAGTLDDNFITRAFEGREEDITNLINDIFDI